MEEKPWECIVLGELLGRSPPCLQDCTGGEYPSYLEGKRGRGCWVAHTALCIFEAARVRRDVSEVLGRKGVDWKTVTYALVLHDSGKLSEEYILGSYPSIHHNEISAQMAYDVLGALVERGRIGTEVRKIVSCSCFLHMEYYEWRSMMRGGYATLDQLTTSREKVSFGDTIRKPLENLKLTLSVMGEIDDDLTLLISEMSKIRRLKLVPSSYVLGSLSRKSALKALALQWFILLFDNRASSARKGSDKYWSRVLEDAERVAGGTETSAEKILELSDLLISRLRGRLTPLPKRPLEGH